MYTRIQWGTTKTHQRKAAIAFGRMVQGKWTTAKAECLGRWPSLQLVCRRRGLAFVIFYGDTTIRVTSDKSSAARAWSKCLKKFNGELTRNRGR